MINRNLCKRTHLLIKCGFRIQLIERIERIRLLKLEQLRYLHVGNMAKSAQ